MIDVGKMRKLSCSETSNGGDLYLYNGVLYKFYNTNRSFIEEKERNVNYLKEQSLFAPYVIEIFYENGEFIGYSLEYINNSRNFREAIDDNSLSYERKIELINGIFSKLRMLHERGIVVGDMHAQNLLYNDEDSYLIDLDEIRFIGVDDFKFEDKYLIKPCNGKPHINVASPYTDNVKTTIACLSMLVGFDMESLIVDKILNISDVKDWLIRYMDDIQLRNRIFELLDSKDEVIYFDEVLNNKGRGAK